MIRLITIFELLVVMCTITAGDQRQMITIPSPMQETAREAAMIDRGFYHITGFRIDDTPITQEDCHTKVIEGVDKYESTELVMVQFNLSYYQNQSISDIGLQNLDLYMTELEQTGKRLIIRMLYDWQGSAQLYQPDNIETILTHMRQTAPILNKHQKCIFLTQGLFFGSWGEMNKSVYNQEAALKLLAETWADALDDRIFLSVRTPSQWRTITGVHDAAGLLTDNTPLASRIGLFNDGILGNESDLGTTAADSASNTGASAWSRMAEITFQEILCRDVPNGGEIIASEYSQDLHAALKTLAQMHVTYLNAEYDRAVYLKWQEITIQEDSCYDGLDGLSYMLQRLGYRFVINNVSLSAKRSSIHISASIRNIGFAPIYSPVDLSVLVVNPLGVVVAEIPCEKDIRSLTGLTASEQKLRIQQTVDMSDLPRGLYSFYLSILHVPTGSQLQTANVTDVDPDHGMLLGKAMVLK